MKLPTKIQIVYDDACHDEAMAMAKLCRWQGLPYTLDYLPEMRVQLSGKRERPTAVFVEDGPKMLCNCEGFHALYDQLGEKFGYFANDDGKIQKP